MTIYRLLSVSIFGAMNECMLLLFWQCKFFGFGAILGSGKGYIGQTGLGLLDDGRHKRPGPDNSDVHTRHRMRL